MVAADPAGGDDHGLGGVLELADLVAVAGPAALHVVGGEHGSVHAGDGAAVLDQAVDAVAEAEGDQALGDGLADPPLEGRDHAGTGAPGEVEPRHRVAVAARATVAALGPADDREHPQALVVEPLPLLAGGEGDVRLGPAPRPVVALAVELGAAHPVLEGQLVGVLDAHPALLGGVDQEETAERPERLAAEALLRLLVEQQHLLAGVGELGGGSQAGEAGSDDDDVCVHGRDPDTA